MPSSSSSSSFTSCAIIRASRSGVSSPGAKTKVCLKQPEATRSADGADGADERGFVCFQCRSIGEQRGDLTAAGLREWTAAAAAAGRSCGCTYIIIV